VLKDHPPPEVATSVFVNGLGQSQLPYGGGHSRLGLLPVLLHPDPVAVAIIGLGSGDTVFSAGGRQETASIDCIEIVLPQLETLRRLERRRLYPGLTALLEDPRVQYAFTDGRVFLARGRRAYDIIEADALRPTTADSGNLYSLEYFELIRTRLKLGGFGVTWGPTPRILDTFLAVFPHVLRFDDILIGSESPIVFDRPLIQARLADPFTRAYYGRGGIDAEQQIRKLVERGPVVYGPELDRASLKDINTDLFPKDEYRVPQSSTHYR
jgi:spermidine synthase